MEGVQDRFRVVDVLLPAGDLVRGERAKRGKSFAKGTFHDRTEHLDIVLEVLHAPVSRLHRAGRFLQFGKGNTSGCEVPERECRGDEPDVRLDIRVEHVLGICGRGDVKASGHEQPHGQGEVVRLPALPRHEANLELKGEPVVDLGGDVYHSNEMKVSPASRSFSTSSAASSFVSMGPAM